MDIRDDCVFCKIANHVFDSNIVYEDELVCAFRDLNPLAPTHVLVVPKEHYESIMDDVPGELFAALMHAAREVARIEGIGATGVRIVSNAGEDAGQAVPHLHLHVLGGRRLGDDFA